MPTAAYAFPGGGTISTAAAATASFSKKATRPLPPSTNRSSHADAASPKSSPNSLESQKARLPNPQETHQKRSRKKPRTFANSISELRQPLNAIVDAGEEDDIFGLGSSPENFNFIVRPKIEGEILNFYVLKRPELQELLKALSTKFELVIFTAGLKEYASLVLNQIDRKSVISHRLYRDSYTKLDGRFVKDLSEMGRDLSRVVIVDDNPNAYIFQPKNAIPVRTTYLSHEMKNQICRWHRGRRGGGSLR